MKKLILAVATAFVISSTASMAGTVREECGCGLGAMAFGDQEATMLLGFCGSLLNGLFGNQTFGISSGTSDCDQAGAFVGRKKVEEFVSSNMDHLAMDMAMGQGETLEALADLMAKAGDDRFDMFASLQTHFASVFTSGDVTAVQVVENIESVLGS